MSNPIDSIRTKLKRYPHLSFHADERSIRVDAPDDDGFPVSLYIDANEFIVSFGGWHEHFDNEQEALECFAFGLSNSARLKVLSRGNFEYKWVLESREGGDWLPVSVTGLLLVPFWRRKHVRYLQNDVIPEDNP